MKYEDHLQASEKLMASGAFICIGGKTLLVQPTYIDAWKILGGLVERNESAHQALET